MSAQKLCLFLIFFTKEEPPGGWYFFFFQVAQRCPIAALKTVARIVWVNPQRADLTLDISFSHKRNYGKAGLEGGKTWKSVFLVICLF